ncbi:integrator complex subunit 6-like [Talpa occidentalis]|uniref:integrator complex subunit 6-like n=1 Tax=Talpa occidentalis TaxID=50954 RepID=UPI00188F171B|nr:integrator complex subunit 6-like [Talpa occidentalis]
MTGEAEVLAEAPENERKYGESKSRLSSGKRLSMTPLSVKKEGEDESHPRASGLCVEDDKDAWPHLLFRLCPDDPKATAVHVLGPKLSRVPLNPEAVGADIKHELRKAIRLFGRKYERIFKLLKGVQGPPQMRRKLVEFTIKEAARFKRRDLIQRLEREFDKIDSGHFLKKDHSTPNA